MKREWWGFLELLKNKPTLGRYVFGFEANGDVIPTLIQYLSLLKTEKKSIFRKLRILFFEGF